MLEMHKLPFRTAQMHLELAVFVSSCTLQKPWHTASNKYSVCEIYSYWTASWKISR